MPRQGACACCLAGRLASRVSMLLHPPPQRIGRIGRARNLTLSAVIFVVTAHIIPLQIWQSVFAFLMRNLQEGCGFRFLGCPKICAGVPISWIC